MRELVEKRQQNSKTFELDGGKRRLTVSIGALHYKDEQSKWQDIDPNFEEADTDGFNLKFSKLPYLIRVAEDSGRRIYPDRNDLSYWIEFKKPFASMGKPTRSVDGWFYWDFANARIGVKVRPEAVKFGFRLKNSNAPTSITIPFSSQGITRQGNLLYHNGKVVGYLRKPTAIDALGVEKDCQVSFGSGSVTISLNTTGLAFPIDIDPTFSVGASSDDCVGQWNGSAWTMNDLTYAYQSAGYAAPSGRKIGGGLRFLNVTIPKEATIDTAYLTIVCGLAKSGTIANSRITGEDVDNAATWSTLADYQARRGTVVDGANNDYITTAQVDWDDIPAWTEGISYDSPPIISIIQEIVNRVGWASGNALALWWDDHDGRSTEATNCYRSGSSWDHATYAPPALTVEYTVVPTIKPSSSIAAKMVAAGLI